MPRRVSDAVPRIHDLALDSFSSMYVRRMSTGKCPVCYTVVHLGRLIVDDEGTFSNAVVLLATVFERARDQHAERST